MISGKKLSQVKGFHSARCQLLLQDYIIKGELGSSRPAAVRDRRALTRPTQRRSSQINANEAWAERAPASENLCLWQEKLLLVTHSLRAFSPGGDRGVRSGAEGGEQRRIRSLTPAPLCWPWSSQDAKAAAGVAPAHGRSHTNLFSGAAPRLPGASHWKKLLKFGKKLSPVSSVGHCSSH